MQSRIHGRPISLAVYSPPPASIRDSACIRDLASTGTNEVWPSACIRDPASVRGKYSRLYYNIVHIFCGIFHTLHWTMYRTGDILGYQ